MPEDGDLRSLLQTLGSAALGIGLGLAILGGGFLISRMTLADSTVVASGAPATATVAPTVRPTATGTARPTVAPTANPTTASFAVNRAEWKSTLMSSGPSVLDGSNS